MKGQCAQLCTGTEVEKSPCPSVFLSDVIAGKIWEILTTAQMQLG